MDGDAGRSQLREGALVDLLAVKGPVQNDPDGDSAAVRGDQVGLRGGVGSSYIVMSILAWAPVMPA